MVKIHVSGEDFHKSLLLIVYALRVRRYAKRIPAKRTLYLPDDSVNGKSHDWLRHKPQNVMKYYGGM